MAASAVSDPLILTIDIGTSSLRAMLFDQAAQAVPGVEARAETPLRTTYDGGVELDPEALFGAVVAAIDDLLLQAGSAASNIVAVAGATLVGAILGLDGADRPVTPIYTWADTRGAEAAARLRAELDEPAVYERTGCPLRSSYAPAQLRWLKTSQPELWRRVRRWCGIADYLTLRLFGASAVSYSVASWSGMLDRRRLRWDPELLSASGVSVEQLSPLVDRDRPSVGLAPPWAARWPALAAIPWFPAVGDGVASSVGCGCVRPRQMALALGTSGAVRVMVEHDVERIPPGLWVYRVDRRRSLLGGALSEGGGVFAWLGETLALAADPAVVEAELAALPPDAHGLTVLPFLAGERSPGWHGDARAVIAGLSLHTRPAEILRAGLEAVGYRFRLLVELARQGAPLASEIVASGGPIVASPAWAQIITDILQRPLHISAEPQATSRGVAVLTLEALGMINDLDSLPASIAAPSTPNPAHAGIYHAGAERQRRLYDLLIPPTAAG